MLGLLSKAEDCKAKPFDTMAGNNQDPRIALAIANRKSPIASTRRKRNFAEFSTPVEREYLPKPETEWAPTIGDFLAAGGDLTQIMSHMCQLTNDIYPILGDGNLSVCPEVINPSEFFDDEYAYCMSPHFADKANLKGLVKKRQPASILPKDNIIMRTILQLASRMIEDEGTLPFWAGIIDCVTGEGEDAEISFKVHPRRRLSKDCKERVLQYLRGDFAKNLRFHFKVFRDDFGAVDQDTSAITSTKAVTELDPLSAICEKNDEFKFYGCRDGKRTYDEKAKFPHLQINIAQWQCLQPLATLRTMTISQIQIEMFHHASTICHELAHAMEINIVDPERFSMPPLNDEVAIEIGFALEQFLYGACPVPERACPFPEGMYLLQWPCDGMCDTYAKGDCQAIELVGTNDPGPDRYMAIEPQKVQAFFLQSFWDDPNPPVGCRKKMWLKPCVELALDPVDFDFFTTGDTPPSLPELKRVRPNSMTKERVREINKAGRKLTQSRYRLFRSRDHEEKRKAEFYEQEKGRLDELWAETMKGV
jgi:hypothetical protein